MTMTAYPTLALPPAPGYDWAALHAQWVDGDPYQPEPLTPQYYQVKAQVAAWIQPRAVVEIGVRAGYSAIAFHMGHPYRRVVGLDLDEGTMGGVAGYAAHARARLAARRIHATVHVLDTQALEALPPDAWGADLCHVDGDHTPHGCGHDILLAVTSGARWILVDDYDYTEHVRDGTDFVVQALGLPASYVSDGGYRGNLLIRNR